MVNQYSIEVHNFITSLINKTQEDLDNSHRNEFNQGRLDELVWIREYLSEHIDLKEFNYY